MAQLVALVADGLMSKADEQQRQLADVLDAVESTAGGFGEVLKEAEVLQVGSDSDGRDRNVLLVEIGHQLVMVAILAIGVAVGKQDHLMHRDAAGETLALGDFKRFLEVVAATGFKPLDPPG